MKGEKGAGQKRKRYLIEKGFQMRFILKFCGLVVLGCLLFGVIVYFFSTRTVTTSFENSRLTIKTTADFILPILIYGAIIVATLISIVCAVMLLLISHKIAGPLYRLQRYAKAIGSGDIPIDFHVRKKDEVQSVAREFNEMLQNLRSGISEIKRGSKDLDGPVSELKRSVRDEASPPREKLETIVDDLESKKAGLDEAISHFKVPLG